ncbi:MAG: 3'-5' exonuclease [Coriobacteriales bacterium]
MNLTQALATANELSLPGFFQDDQTLRAERAKNEDAIATLLAAWRAAPAGQPPFDFGIVRELADRNREVCDAFGAERLRNERGANLASHLSDDDLIRGVARMQHRPEADVRRSAGADCKSLDAAYVEAPVSGMICGVDIETTDRYPDRGYIINVGMQFMPLTPTARADKGYVAYCGIPDLYREKGVPLSDIHHITWADLDGKKPFRENAALQKALLASFERYPFMAHNAAFEDSWFMLHLDGYAEARKAGRIVPIDTRDICRRIDPDVRTLPRETHPATLENWARRRGTLLPEEKERHLGLDDVDLMLRTVQAEFSARNMFA